MNWEVIWQASDSSLTKDLHVLAKDGILNWKFAQITTLESVYFQTDCSLPRSQH